MSDISLVFIFVGAVTFLKQAWDYKNNRIPDRNVEVNRLKDIDEFCRYASRYNVINALITVALFAIVASERFFNMRFHFTWYFGLLIIFLYRIFRYPRSFEAYYKPITLQSKEQEASEGVDEEEVDE